MNEIMDFTVVARQIAEREIARCIADFEAGRDLQYDAGEGTPRLVIPAGPVPGVLVSKIVGEESHCQIHNITYGLIPRSMVHIDRERLRRTVWTSVWELLEFYARRETSSPWEWRKTRVMEWIWRSLRSEILEQTTDALQHCPEEAILSKRYTHRHLYSMQQLKGRANARMKRQDSR